MNKLPCAWCGARLWIQHCQDERCRWLRCGNEQCGALLDLQGMVLLPPAASGEGPMPAE